MLVDPYGNRLQNSTSIEIDSTGKIVDGTGEFAYLVEACDPCEADAYGYPIQGITVSDFITPHFYEPVVTPGTRYSFTGAIKAPRQILPGGYISWVNQEIDEMQQLLWVDPKKKPVIRNIGPATGGSLRVFIDNYMHSHDGKATVRFAQQKPNKTLIAHNRAKRVNLEKIAEARAQRYAAAQ